MPLSFTKYSKGYPAIGYTKQLQQTGFIFVDSDKTEEYALDYQFTVYGKHMTDKTPKSLMYCMWCVIIQYLLSLVEL